LKKRKLGREERGLKMKYISYAESFRELKKAWNNEPVVFTGGIRLNHEGKKNKDSNNTCYND